MILSYFYDIKIFKQKSENNFSSLLIKLEKYSIIMRLEMLVNTFRLLLNIYLGFELK